MNDSYGTVFRAKMKDMLAKSAGETSDRLRRAWYHSKDDGTFFPSLFVGLVILGIAVYFKLR